MTRKLPSYQTEGDRNYASAMESHLKAQAERQTLSAISNGFAKYAKRQEITRFLIRNELFRQIVDVQGSIAECGVLAGHGLMTWAQLSAIYEPVGGAFRQVFGFDTFAGFPSVDERDLEGKAKLDWKAGDLANDSFADLQKCIELFDMNRFLPQFPKVELVKGDFTQSAVTFLAENPHVLFSILYLDFDLYEPTLKALELFLPRCAKGAIVAFDEVNHPIWPGETLAMLKAVDLPSVRLKKFPYEPNVSYFVVGQ
jgi:hypothetical protein